jgi:Ribosome associated membrane protein RAMP4
MDVDAQPTPFEMRQKNELFAQKVREGKNAVKPSTRDKLANKSPIPLWALGLCIFVVIGGCECFSEEIIFTNVLIFSICPSRL